MAQQGANNTYWGHIREAFTTLLKGLELSLAHLKAARKKRPPIYVSDSQYFTYDTGIVTLQYPKEKLPVPDNGRYKLHNEIDDCIVCDKCAKICPVNCIEIEPIRAVEEIGKTSDGSSKRIYAAKFDIDMGKCCFCGLCTTVCPTECLTMTKDYDFSEYDVADHNFSFSEMTPLEILEKQNALEAYMQAKEAAKTAKATDTSGNAHTGEKSKPVFKPKVGSSGAKPVFKPKTATGSIKPVIKKKEEPATEPEEGEKPAVKPKMGTAKPVIKPKIGSKPVIKRKEETQQDPQEMAKKIMEQKRAQLQQKEDDNTDQNSDSRQ